MRTIWKYDLDVINRQVLDMPSGAEILSVQCQGGAPKLWAEVETDRGTEKRIILTIGTGHLMSNDRVRYLGTYQRDRGAFIGHVFEEL